MITQIPFSGFYETIHAMYIDDAEYDLFRPRDGNGCEEPNPGLLERFRRASDYSKVHTEYAKKYAAEFSDKFKIEFTFNSLNSPREYNFTTDHIFVNIAFSEISRIKRAVTNAQLQAVAIRELTSRSGFASFYDPDIKTFGPLKSWDHGKLSILVMAYVENHANYEEDYEDSLTQDFSGNGCIDNWLCAACPITERLYKVFNYLETRANSEGVTA